MASENSLIRDNITSRWPLPADGVRFLVPPLLLDDLHRHPLARDLYPIAMGYYPRARGHRMRRIAHTTHLLMYCTAGTGLLEVDGEQWPVAAGDLILLPPGVPHAYRADDTSPWSLFWVHYGGELSTTYSALLELDQWHRNIGVHARLTGEFENLVYLRQRGVSNIALVQGACRLKALLTDFAVVARQSGKVLGKHIAMEDLLEHMRANVHRDLDLEELAELAHLSRYHFIRSFRRHTGRTPIRHFIHLKMEKACELLDNSELPVKTVAAELGYVDPLYFSRQFKSHVGVSPSDYRQLHTT